MIKTVNGGTIPTKGTKFSAAVDLYANEDVIVYGGNTVVVGLGVSLELDDDIDEYFKRTHYMELHPRSSLRVKGLVSGVGIIDMDYADEIKIVISNMNLDPVKINKGDRIAQLLLKEHQTHLLGIHSDTDRSGGFGSTDDHPKQMTMDFS